MNLRSYLSYIRMIFHLGSIFEKDVEYDVNTLPALNQIRNEGQSENDHK